MKRLAFVWQMTLEAGNKDIQSYLLGILHWLLRLRRWQRFSERNHSQHHRPCANRWNKQMNDMGYFHVWSWTDQVHLWRYDISKGPFSMGFYGQTLVDSWCNFGKTAASRFQAWNWATGTQLKVSRLLFPTRLRCQNNRRTILSVRVIVRIIHCL